MSEPIVLHVEIDAGAEPISGRISAALGFDVRFTGWVGLAAAIERAMGRDGPKDEGRSLMSADASAVETHAAPDEG